MLALYLYTSSIIGNTDFIFGNRLPKDGPWRPKHAVEVSCHVYL